MLCSPLSVDVARADLRFGKAPKSSDPALGEMDSVELLGRSVQVDGAECLLLDGRLLASTDRTNMTHQLPDINYWSAIKAAR